MSSNCCLPSFYTKLYCIVELGKVFHGAGSCKEGALQYVCGIFCRETSFTHSLLRHCHIVHGLSCLLARLSSRRRRLDGVSYSLHLMALGGKFAGFTYRKKPFLDFKRFSAGICQYKEWASFISCLAFSTLVHTSRLMLGTIILLCC